MEATESKSKPDTSKNIEQFKNLLLNYPKAILKTKERQDGTAAEQKELLKYLNPIIEAQVANHIQETLNCEAFENFTMDVERLERAKENLAKNQLSQSIRNKGNPAQLSIKDIELLCINCRNKKLQVNIARNNTQINQLMEEVEKKRNTLRDMSSQLNEL